MPNRPLPEPTSSQRSMPLYRFRTPSRRFPPRPLSLSRCYRVTGIYDLPCQALLSQSIEAHEDATSPTSSEIASSRICRPTHLYLSSAPWSHKALQKSGECVAALHPRVVDMDGPLESSMNHPAAVQDEDHLEQMPAHVFLY